MFLRVGWLLSTGALWLESESLLTLSARPLEQRSRLVRSRVFSERRDERTEATSLFERLSQALPFPTCADADLFSTEIRFTAPMLELQGRERYLDVSKIWKDSLPIRLEGFNISRSELFMVNERKLKYRWAVEFYGPLPPQILPAQKRRVAAAKLQPDPARGGKVAVRVQFNTEISVDAQGKVEQLVERIEGDALGESVPSTIARFEVLQARRLPGDLPGVLRYMGVVRWLMREEFVELQERSESDEARVLGLGAKKPGEGFEFQFVVFVAQNFAMGGFIGIVIYCAIKLATGGPDALIAALAAWASYLSSWLRGGLSGSNFDL